MTVWHLPLVFLADGGLEPAYLVVVIVATFAVTFWYSWLFNHTGGSVLLVLVAHSVEGSIQNDSLIYTGVWLAAALCLIIFDWRHWRASAPEEATTSFASTASRRANGPAAAP